jgi:hypothetical protein
MKRGLWLGLVCLLAAAVNAAAQAGRIYSQPVATDTGGITGTMPSQELTHAIAVDHERLKVFRATLTSNDQTFRFEHLPVGKYDLVLVTKHREMFEGVRLGEPLTSLSTDLQTNLEKRIALADSFFNRYKIHRSGVDGDRALVLVERLRDKLVLKQSGETLPQDLRRLEIIELDKSVDDWQMIQSRHLYREGEPIEKSPPFWRDTYVPALGAIRVVSGIKELGTLELPKD